MGMTTPVGAAHGTSKRNSKLKCAQYLLVLTFVSICERITRVWRIRHCRSESWHPGRHVWFWLGEDAGLGRLHGAISLVSGEFLAAGRADLDECGLLHGLRPQRELRSHHVPGAYLWHLHQPCRLWTNSSTYVALLCSRHDNSGHNSC